MVTSILLLSRFSAFSSHPPWTPVSLIDFWRLFRYATKKKLKPTIYYTIVNPKSHKMCWKWLYERVGKIIAMVYLQYRLICFRHLDDGAVSFQSGFLPNAQSMYRNVLWLSSRLVQFIFAITRRWKAYKRGKLAENNRQQASITCIYYQSMARPNASQKWNIFLTYYSRL